MTFCDCSMPSSFASRAQSPMPFAWLARRGLRTTALALESIDLKVPQMGDSITEGTIAAVLKKPGEEHL